MVMFVHYRFSRVVREGSPWVGSLIALPLLLLSASANAAGFDSLQIHGFASQAFIQTSDNNFFGDSDDGGTFDFRELGLNASLRPLPYLLLSAQLLSRSAGETDDGDPRLDYGFVDYSFVSDGSSRLGLRLGRIKNPLGLYNETRDVPFTRPSILLPQSIYFDRTRNLALSANIAQVYGEHWTQFGDVSFQFGAGEPIVDDLSTEVGLLGRDLPGELEEDLSFIGRVLYERDGGRIRLALSGAQANVDYDPGAPFPNDLLPGSFRFEPLIASAEYNTQYWSLTTEYALRKFQFRDLGAIPDGSITGESFYIQGVYRFNAKWEGLLRYDVLYTNKDDRGGSEFAAATGLPAHSRFAKDLTVGLTWHVTPSFMVRAEYHNINGTAWLTPLDNPDITETEEHWDLFAIQASYRF